MKRTLPHLLACALLTAGATSLAHADSHYTTGFTLAGVSGLADGSAGRWTGDNISETFVYTGDWTGSGWTAHDAGQRDVHAGGPAFGSGQNLAAVSEAPGIGSFGSAWIGGDSLGTDVTLRAGTGREASAQVGWHRDFVLNPHSSITFTGTASMRTDGSSQGPAVPVGHFHAGRVDGMDGPFAEATLQFVDSVGSPETSPVRASLALGVVLQDGGVSTVSGIGHANDANGLMSLTFTNPLDTELAGTLNFSTYVNALVPAVPEPASVLSLLLGLGVVGAAAQRARRQA